MNKAIKLQNVTKAFASKIAVDSVNLDIEGGKITGFLGPNGAGKTTTINMIVGILSPTHGKVTVNGYDVTQDGYESKKLISYIPDNPLINSHHTRISPVHNCIRIVHTVRGLLLL